MTGLPTGRGGRHPLLLNQRFNESVFWPSILTLAFSAALLVWPSAALAPHRCPLSVVLLGTGLVLVLTFLFRLRAYVQCRQNGLRIQLPFYHLTIPYEEMRTSRPNDFFRLFPPKEQPFFQRRFIEPLLAKTVIVIDLRQFPRRKPILRLWMSRYMLNPASPGLILAVRDWIAFRTELDEFRSKSRLPRKQLLSGD